ncbi:MAG: diguanylate cyclase [Mycolicibacterium sp.]|uniref:diguanylate cyclase domain-containing protein n=1 Tax=Mycolicibacterium sp. TaxID=2320850 RepID=UPI003D116406
MNKSDKAPSGVREDARLSWWGRLAVGVVFVVVAANWVGWATGLDWLTRSPSAPWAQMTPWSGLFLAALGLAILVQTGRKSHLWVWVGLSLAVIVCVLAVAMVAQYAANMSFGLDRVWFSETMHGRRETWPGRPSLRTVSSVAPLAIAVGLLRLDPRGTRVVWPLCLASATLMPLVTATSYLFGDISLEPIQSPTRQGIWTAVCLLLLIGATLVQRPDRNPLAWLQARPDRWALLRLGAMLAGLPILVGLSRLALLALDLRPALVRDFSVTIGVVGVGLAAFFLSQREQKLLIEKESISNQRAEAEARYRLLADNAVDIIVRLRGRDVVWISPSAQAAFGDPPQQWVGSDFSRRIHPEDLDGVIKALSEMAPDASAVARFRMHTADGGYHWVEGHAKPYTNAQSEIDGIIAALRIVDDQVEAHRQLEQLARFDALTGLVNRAEAITRLQAALEHPRTPGQHLGVLFCDVDHFKAINDTWGHTAGDLTLSSVADRIRRCLRDGDTVGRTGGDEILVLLPGLHDIHEATQIADKIRRQVAAPVDYLGKTIHPTLSIGATIAIPGEPVSAVTTRADNAMYQAKNAGRNNTVSI